MTPKSQHTPVAMLNAAGLVVAAAGIMIQYVSGVDFPTIPPGRSSCWFAATVVVFGPWRKGPCGRVRGSGLRFARRPDRDDRGQRL
jgi:hypothetical protein